jgi:hypothetical protein
MENQVYKKLKEFKEKHPLTISWRIKHHAKVIETHLNPGETVTYAFAAQKNDSPYDIFMTYAVVLTNKRIILAQKRLIFGYFYTAITPDMFNDITLKSGIIWGKVLIDTVKELVVLSNIDKKALGEIETYITEYMMEEKKKYSKEA